MAENLVRARTQGPHNSDTSFAKDVSLSARSDPSASDEEKLRALMRGVKDEIFCGLVRNPPTTVEEFVAEATNIERALLARAGRYHRSVNVPAHTTSSLDCSVGVSNLREILRDVVREEIKKLLPLSY